MNKTSGRLTLPGEENFLTEIKELIEKLGADAVRDSDGTKLPDAVKDIKNVDIYTTYFVAREHNEFAKKYLGERQQVYLTSEFVTALNTNLEIDVMQGYYKEQIEPDLGQFETNSSDESSAFVKKYWQVINRTTGQEVELADWGLNQSNKIVLKNATPFHQYSVNFLAYVAWDPTSMYNHLTNDWGDREHQIPFNAMAENSAVFMEDELERWLQNNPKTDVVRFTTFFYHFTLIYNSDASEKYVDWFGYSQSISKEALAAFEKEKGYRLKAEDIVDQGYYNSPFRIPTTEFLDYLDFMAKFVAEKAKRLVELVHRYDKKAVMFLGDNWIGTEPYGKYFADIGLDGVVGSVGDGVTLRVISEIPDVSFTEGRFLPYFFPDTFFTGNDPTLEAADNWLAARRAILRKPLDRIGYGGYLSLAYQFPEFIDYIAQVAAQYRQIMHNIDGATPYTSAKVAILNSWGKLRSWQAYIVAHGKWYKGCYSYLGMLEALSGMDMDVVFISFEDIVNQGIDPEIDVIINAGAAGTAWSGGENFANPLVIEAIRKFVHSGGGLIGIGEPSAYQANGRYFQLADLFGVDREMGLSQSVNRYNCEPVVSHFILDDFTQDYTFDLGEPINNIVALADNTEVLIYQDHEVKMAANKIGKGRSFYVTGLPYSRENTRLLKRAIHYVAGKEKELTRYFAEDPAIEVAAFPGKNTYCVYNNSLSTITTRVYDGLGRAFELELEPAELKWFTE